MIRKILYTLILVTVVCIYPVYATPPSAPHIESGSAADGGNYFQYNASYNGGSGWKDLKTPPHWVVETGEIAYCLEHLEDSPHGESYTSFNPTTVYSDRTYKGLLAILEHSYPYRNAGLSDSQIRYATSNAIRSWLKESAGIGYDFMLPSNNAVRAKSGAYQSAFNFYNQLLDKARNASIINHTLTANPSTIDMQVQGGKLVGKTTIRYPVLNGKYKINTDKLPEGVNISGYVGNNGEVITITAPLSMIGQTINLDNVFTGYDNRCPQNIAWLDNSSGRQAVVVPIVDKMSPVVTTSIKLKSTPSTVTIIKHGEDASKLLSGATFGIYKSSDDTLIEQLTTGNNGKATSSNLDIGDYYLKEITRPVGYVLDSTKQPFSITTTNRQITLDVHNSRVKGRLSITKTDEAGNPLESVVFGLYGTDKKLIGELTTNDEGKAISKELVYGKYYIKELSTLEGFNLDNSQKPFQIVDNNKVVELNIINKVIHGKVKITTKDVDNNPLKGSVYSIFDKNDILVDEITTNKDGIALSNDLRYGDYYLKEKTPPQGYVKNDTTISFKILKQDKVVELIAANTRIYGRVQLKKTSENDNPLQGVKFGVYTADDKLVEDFTTDENGIAISKELFYGDYYLKEIKAPNGYNLDDNPIPFKILKDGEIVKLDVVNNLIRGKVKVSLVNDMDEPLKDATYGIYDKKGILIQEINTSEKGEAISKNLVFGEYYIKEITPSIGHVINEALIPFEIKIQDKIVEVTAVNTRIHGTVQIKKIGENDNPLSGVVLGVYSTEDNLIEKLTTDENGSAISKELFYGDYYIKEIQPLEGYVLDETKHSFSIVDNDETVNIDISNKWIRGEVEVVLTDSETDEPLKCAVFGIYTMDDELIDEITIDDNGYVLSNNLIYGEYYVKEMKSPVGYNLDKDKYPFTVDTNEKIIHLDVKNSIIKGGVQITNTSASDGAFIQGSVFELYDKDGRIIKELTTDNKGKITLSDLKYGEYYLQETSVPYGYVLDNIKHPFNIREDNKTINISILNHPIVGSVEVYFKDIKHGHEISKPYSYTDWIGRDYMPWVMGNGLDKKNIDGYKFVKADYPEEKELIDDKLIITYWYDGL